MTVRMVALSGRMAADAASPRQLRRKLNLIEPPGAAGKLVPLGPNRRTNLRGNTSSCRAHQRPKDTMPLGRLSLPAGRLDLKTQAARGGEPIFAEWLQWLAQLRHPMATAA